MTPIPPDVAAAIVAAGHSLSADVYTGPSVLRQSAWWWKYNDGRIERSAPKWSVTIDDERRSEDGGMCGHGAGPTPREAVLKALQQLIARSEERAATWSAKGSRARIDERKASCAAEARGWLAKAADARALAAQVAAMWPEVTP
mgnify:FL=1